MFLKDLNYAMEDEIGFEQVETGEREGALRGESDKKAWTGQPSWPPASCQVCVALSKCLAPVCGGFLVCEMRIMLDLFHSVLGIE